MNVKLILFAVIALVVGLGGSTAVVVMRAPKAPAKGAAAQHGAAAGPSLRGGVMSSSSSAATPAEAARAGLAKAEGSDAPPVAPALPPAHSPGAANQPAPSVRPGATALARTPGSVTEGYRQMAGIMKNMNPPDAGKIMAFLSDEQVQGILVSVGARQAAVMLTSLPPQRAAAISRRVIAEAGMTGK